MGKVLITGNAHLRTRWTRQNKLGTDHNRFLHSSTDRRPHACRSKKDCSTGLQQDAMICSTA